jgi:hypothetical protein
VSAVALGPALAVLLGPPSAVSAGLALAAGIALLVPPGLAASVPLALGAAPEPVGKADPDGEAEIDGEAEPDDATEVPAGDATGPGGDPKSAEATAPGDPLGSPVDVFDPPVGPTGGEAVL